MTYSTHSHGSVFDAAALWRAAALGEGAIDARPRGAYIEQLTTIFVERENPEAGLVYENPDGTWHIDFPPGSIHPEKLLDLAYAIVEVLGD